MTEIEKEQRRYAMAVSGGRCEVCGKPLYMGQVQGAHRIGNTKANRKKYGDFVLDHRYNIGMTCSLKCNAELDISMKPNECIRLCIKIYKAEEERWKEVDLEGTRRSQTQN